VLQPAAPPPPHPSWLEGPPDDGATERDGHAGVSRRQILTVLGIAGTAAACTGAVTVVTNHPNVGHAPVAPAAPPAAPAPAAKAIGLRAGAGGISAPKSDKSLNDSANSKVWMPQKAPAARAFATLRQPPTILVLDQVLHLARRATYGITPTLAGQIRRAGTRNWVERQLAPATINDAATDALLKRYPLLTKTPAQVKAFADGTKDASYFAASDQLAEAKIIRAAFSNRQLFEMMAEFWSDWLHVPGYNDKTRFTVADFDRTVIRRYTFGRFVDMLWASTTHPAMLRYLDAAESRKDNVNQNLGREILELHSLGVGNYQPRTDIVQASLVLTGLGIDEDTLAFKYDPGNHYVGPVKVLNWSSANRDPKQGLQVVKSLVGYLAMHASTAKHLATDLARRFVSDAPPAGLVNRLAVTYLRNRTAIVPVLRELFASQEFAVSVGQKYRRPLEATAASIRTLGITVNPGANGALTDDGAVKGIRDLRYQLDQLGHVPHGHPAPDGYADFADAWLSGGGTLGRWNLNTSFAQDWWKGLTHASWETLYGGTPRTYGDAVDRLTRRLLYQPVTAAQRAALLEFLGKPASAPVGTDRTLGGKLVPLIALILDAPHHQLR
jgi:uncharacterized protein (DUF1800 family)